jgi:hypothetical protein
MHRKKLAPHRDHVGTIEDSRFTWKRRIRIFHTGVSTAFQGFAFVGMDFSGVRKEMRV